MVETIKGVELCLRAKFRQNRSNRGWDMTVFRFFQDGGGRHLGFSKFQIFDDRGCQGVELHHRAKFRQNRLNRGRDMAIFRFFKMAVAAILDFENFKFLTVGAVKRIDLHHRAKFRQNRSNRGWDITIIRFFQDGGRLPSWICNACVGTTHEGHLVVFITVQNLVGIDAVVLTICIFFDFASLAWKRLFTPQNWGFWGFWPPKWGAVWKTPQKGTSLRESASFEPSCVKIRRRVWP